MSRQAGCEEQSSGPVAELALGDPRERWVALIYQREDWGWLTELTAQKAAAPRGADVLIVGGFDKDLSHPPYCLGEQRTQET